MASYADPRGGFESPALRFRSHGGAHSREEEVSAEYGLELRGYYQLTAPAHVTYIEVPYVDWRHNWWTARHSFGHGACPVDAWEGEGGAIQWDVDPDTVD